MWADQSPAENDATQVDPTRRPTLVPAGSAGGLPTHALVRFDNTQFLSVSDDVTLRWSAHDFALYTVVRFTNPLSEWTIVYGKWTDVGPDYPGLFLWANYPNTVVTPVGFTGFVGRVDAMRIASAPGPFNDNALRVVGLRRIGNTLQIRINGTLIGSSNVSGFNSALFDAVGRPAFIGGRPEGGQAFHGGISELIGVRGTLTDSEVVQLETYLKTKFEL